MYYGDDIGMPGGNDPDNRRMMRFDGLSDKEEEVKSTLQTLTALRKSRMELLYGDFLPIDASDGLLSYSRTYLGNTSLIFFNKSKYTVEFSTNAVPNLMGENLKANFGSEVSYFAGEIKVSMAPYSFEIITN